MNEQLFPGPCICCGRTDYPLSMGGPGICPRCDCGNWDPQRLLKELMLVRAALTASEARVRLLEQHLSAMTRGSAGEHRLPQMREVEEARAALRKEPTPERPRLYQEAIAPSEAPYSQADYDRNAIRVPDNVKITVPSIGEAVSPKAGQPAENMVWVPREPTKAMVAAASDENDCFSEDPDKLNLCIYKAMIAAAPSVGEQEKER